MDCLENYKAGAIWKLREDVRAYSMKHKSSTIKKDSLIVVLKIIEEPNYMTHIKFLHNKEIYYMINIDDIRMTFIY